MIIKTKPTEYDLFVKYGKLTKQLLYEVFNLSRYPEDENVQVTFISPIRAYAKIITPLMNGGNINPTITFNYDAFEYLENENFGGFAKENRLQEDGSWKLVPAPLVYKLSFKVYINAATPMDADKLQYQILAYCRKNRPAVKFYEGQWVEWVADSPGDEDVVEPGLDDKLVRRSCMLHIRRAYLPVDYITSTNIEEINIKLEETNSIEEEEYNVNYYQ